MLIIVSSMLLVLCCRSAIVQCSLSSMPLPMSQVRGRQPHFHLLWRHLTVAIAIKLLKELLHVPHPWVCCSLLTTMLAQTMYTAGEVKTSHKTKLLDQHYQFCCSCTASSGPGPCSEWHCHWTPALCDLSHWHGWTKVRGGLWKSRRALVWW